MVERLTLVFLSGWGFSETIWRDFIASITEFNCLLIKNDVAFSLEDTVALIPNNSIVVGWSLGGLHALQLAHHYPDKIKKTISICSSPKFTAANSWPGINDTEQNTFSELLLNIKKLQQYFLALVSHPNSEKSIRKSLMGNMLNFQDNELLLRDSLNFLFTHDARTHLQNCQKPLLYIFGRDDAIVPYNAINPIESLNSKIQTEIISGCGHAPMVTHPQELRDLIVRFCHA